MSTNIKPTDEQLHAIDVAQNLESMKVSAYAGATKTSTGIMISNSLSDRSKRGLYVVFNKGNQIEASMKMKKGVECRTFNSLAWEGKGKHYEHKMQMRLNGRLIADEFEIESLYLPSGKIPSLAIGNAVLSTISEFCKDMSPEISEIHVPEPDILGLTKNDLMEFRRAVTPYARKLWGYMIDRESPAPIGHNGYMKLWAISNPKISGFDYAIFDEAQDASDLMIEVMNRQDFPVFWFGDRWQQIYAWRGAVNAMQKISVEHECRLTRSFRFGPELAEKANIILRYLGEEVPLIGAGPATRLGAVTQAKAIISRKNATLVQNFMGELARGRKASIQKDKDLLGFCHSARRLKDENVGTGSLSLFKTWKDLVEYSESDDGRDMSSFVNAVSKYGIDNIERAVQKSNPNDCEVILTTAHQCKGLEWDSTFISSDFKLPDLKNPPNEEEIRLVYVALTRGKTEVDARNIDFRKFEGRRYASDRQNAAKARVDEQAQRHLKRTIAKLTRSY